MLWSTWKLPFLCLRDTDRWLISLVSFGLGWDQTKKSKLKCLASSLKFRQMCVQINSSQFWKHWQSTYSSKTRGTRGAGGTRESGFAIFSIWARRTLLEKTMERWMSILFWVFGSSGCCFTTKTSINSHDYLRSTIAKLIINKGVWPLRRWRGQQSWYHRCIGDIVN